MTVYQAMVEAGVEIDSHESDLYVKDTEQAREVLARYPMRLGQRFTCQIDGTQWIDIPFGFDPWWEQRQGKE